MNYLGDYAEDAAVYIIFNTFTSNDPSASCTITNFINTDVHIHKDDGLTQRNNAAGITVSVDFDGITGSHMVKIDTSDNTVAGFWVAGHDYFVRIEGTTIDAATINSVIGQFSIENRSNEVDVVKLLGTAWVTPTVAGTPDINVKSEDNIDFGALKKTSLNASTPVSVTTVTGNVDGSVGSLTGHTVQTGDSYPVVSHADHGNAKLVRSTTPANALDVSATGEAGLDFANIKDATGAHTLTNITVPVTTAVTNEVTADAVKISGDSTAADNLESQYDTTGLSGDTFPATQEQVGNIASGTAATNTVAESVTVSTGTETNAYTDTATLDGTSHIISPVGGSTDFYYQFDVGANGVPVSVQWQGYANAQGDSYAIYAWKWSTSSWEQIGTKAGSSGTTIVSESYDLTTSHVGTGANNGKVRVGVGSYDGTAFGTDRLLCSFATVYQSAGYADGAIWVDTVGGTAGTVDYINGTADNPVLTWADAKTLSVSLGIKKFHIVNGSSVALDSNSDNYTFVGFDYNLALGGQSLESAHIQEANVTGIGTAGAGEIHFKNCYVDSITAEKSHFSFCGFSGTNIGTAATTYIFDHCYNSATGSVPPVLDFGAAIGDTHAALRSWHGGVEIKNLGQLGADVFTITGAGGVTIGATCIAGTIKVVGNFTITDNTAAGFLGTLTDDARYDVGQINDECDTALTDYDPPTRTEATADKDAILADHTVMKQSSAGTYDRDTDSLQAIRDRGDAAWVTGGGGSISDILNIQPLVPNAIDLANTATVRIGLGLTNMVDDLPTTSEITPGTITIDRKAIGGTTWTNIVNAAACSEAAGLIYYDEVFDSTTTYAAGDTIRITFKSQKITVAANDYEITGTDGWIFHTYIREAMRGTDSASTHSAADVLTATVEGTLELKQALQAIMSFAATKVTGGGTTTITFRDHADTKNRVVMTVDTNGDRSAVTYSFD